ncbi:MAG: trypsin-like peptidase domain-containing protein [Bdellovibrionales bacterium]|nr:trypsin-like peptidase domain-containing protein [Bdellovibrionales bacterium]
MIKLLLSITIILYLFSNCGDGFSTRNSASLGSSAGQKCTPLESTKDIKALEAIFGTDDRTGIEENKDFLAWADSVLGYVANEKINMSSGKVESYSDGETLGQFMNLCTNERYWNMPMVAGCTGVLVAPNVMLTAGHCTGSASQTNCMDNKYVFNLSYANNASDPFQADEGSIYGCRQRLYYNNNNDHDLGLVRLDRQVTDRPYFPIHLDRELPLGTKLVDVGHSEAMPLRISPVGEYRGMKQGYRMHDLDVFGGNSGSPVFTRDGRVVGIHAKTMIIFSEGNFSSAHYYKEPGASCYSRYQTTNELQPGKTAEQVYAMASDPSVLKSEFQNRIVALVGKVTEAKQFGDQAVIEGWACAIARDNPVEVTALDSRGRDLDSVDADQESEDEDVERFCQSGTTAHKFTVTTEYDPDGMSVELSMGSESIELEVTQFKAEEQNSQCAN